MLAITDPKRDPQPAYSPMPTPGMQSHHSLRHVAGPTVRHACYQSAASRLINRYPKPDMMAIKLYCIEWAQKIGNCVGTRRCIAVLISRGLLPTAQLMKGCTFLESGAGQLNRMRDWHDRFFSPLKCAVGGRIDLLQKSVQEEDSGSFL